MKRKKILLALFVLSMAFYAMFMSFDQQTRTAFFEKIYRSNEKSGTITSSEQKQLEVRLASLQRKTRDYDFLKEELYTFEERIYLSEMIMEHQTNWASLLQEIAFLTAKYPIWFEKFQIETKESSLDDEEREISYLHPKIMIQGLSRSSDLVFLKAYRQKIQEAEWWKNSFYPNGLSNLNYKFFLFEKSPPSYSLSFDLQMSLKLKRAPQSFRFKSRYEHLNLATEKKDYTSLSEEESIKVLQEQILFEEKKFKMMDFMNSLILQLSRKYQTITTQVPEEEDLETFSDIMQQVAQGINLAPLDFVPKITVLFNKQKKAQKFFLYRIEIPLEFEASFEQCGEFLSRIENLERIVTISELEIQPLHSNKLTPLPQEISLKVKMKLVTYSHYKKLGSGLSISPNTKIEKNVSNFWFPFGAKNPFIPVFSDMILSEEEFLEDFEDPCCRYYDLDSRCTLPQNKISDFCTKHYQLADEISRQENVLKKAKELLKKMEESDERKEQISEQHGIRMDEIFRYPFKVDWIKIEIAEIRERYLKINGGRQEQQLEMLQKEVLRQKEKILQCFSERQYENCLVECQNLAERLFPYRKLPLFSEKFGSIFNECIDIHKKAQIPLNLEKEK